MFVIRTSHDVYGTADARSALEHVAEMRDAGHAPVAHRLGGRVLSSDDLARLVVHSDAEPRRRGTPPVDSRMV